MKHIVPELCGNWAPFPKVYLPSPLVKVRPLSLDRTGVLPWGQGFPFQYLPWKRPQGRLCLHHAISCEQPVNAQVACILCLLKDKVYPKLSARNSLPSPPIFTHTAKGTRTLLSPATPVEASGRRKRRRRHGFLRQVSKPCICSQAITVKVTLRFSGTSENQLPTDSLIQSSGCHP